MDGSYYPYHFFPLYNLYNLYNLYIYGSIWIYNDLDIWIVVVAMPTDPTWVAKSQGRVQFCVEKHVFSPL